MSPRVIILLTAFLTCLAGRVWGGQAPVAHYRLDEAAGQIARDSSPNKHDARIHGATWVKSDRGVALAFDGQSSRVGCGAGARLKLQHTVSIAAWIFPKGRPTGEPVIAGEGPEHWGITHYNSDAFFYVAGGTNHCYVPVPNQRWSHVAATFDGKRMRLYLNGGLRKTRDLLAGTTIPSGMPFVIGAGKRGFFKGLIRDVRVYDRVLTAKEISALVLQPDPAEKKLMTTKEERQAATQFFRQHLEPLASQQSDRQLWLANRHVGIEFLRDERQFRLSRVYGIASGQELLSAQSPLSRAGLWQLVLRRDRGRDPAEIMLTSRSGATVSSSMDRRASAITLRLVWNGLAVTEEPNSLDVEVSVTLRAGDPLSRWRIRVANRSRTYGLWKVVFPVLELGPIGGKSETNAFVCGLLSRGMVVKDPFNTPTRCAFGLYTEAGYDYPAPLNVQFQALHDASGAGLYLATHDGGGYRKTFYFTPHPARQVLEYRIAHLPADMGYPAEGYRMTYDVCIGPFHGDWYDACQVYRKWAVRQRWCRMGPLASREDIPRWYKDAPITVVLVTREGEQCVPEARDRALAFLRFLGAELPVVWYGWKQHFPAMSDYNKQGSPWKVPDAKPFPCSNIHDGNYPPLPALPGFGPACTRIAQGGGHVKAYVCAKIYDPGLNENAPLAPQAKPNAMRDVQGRIKVGESGIVAWRVCPHTKWWQERMRETVVALIRNEHVGGIYFDTFHGGHSQCFDTRHGHSHGGGNDPYLSAQKLAEVVRGAMKEAEPASVISGEGPAETAIDLLDGFLYKDTLRPHTAPIFAAVYGDYICRYGFTMEPESDGFYMQCATLFTEGAQMGRLFLRGRHFNRATDDYLKDFARGSEYTEKMNFLRKLARRWKTEAGGRHLAYGQLLRPIRFIQPDPMPVASYIDARYTHYKDGRMAVAALQAGVFRLTDGSIGIFVVNVTEEPVSFRFELTPDRYPISRTKTYRITPVAESGKRGKPASSRGKITCSGQVAGHDVAFLEVRPH